MIKSCTKEEIDNDECEQLQPNRNIHDIYVYCVFVCVCVFVCYFTSEFPDMENGDSSEAQVEAV
jgi:hypothetical protein